MTVCGIHQMEAVMYFIASIGKGFGNRVKVLTLCVCVCVHTYIYLFAIETEPAKHKQDTNTESISKIGAEWGGWNYFLSNHGYLGNTGLIPCLHGNKDTRFVELSLPLP